MFNLELSSRITVESFDELTNKAPVGFMVVPVNMTSPLSLRTLPLILDIPFILILRENLQR